MNPHLFRHLAGLLFLRAKPDGIETVRRFLGHKYTRTTLKFYAELSSDSAFRSWDEVVAGHREGRLKPKSSIGSRSLK